ncbi:MAG: prepilin-type N-terminal cleavage/methylation domain-containing protein [Pseudomonadota bacterium]
MNDHSRKYNHRSEARPKNRAWMRGLTFIELIVTVVILGIAATGILYTMTINTRSSADPMVQEQAILIAESYMEEILLKKFLDPSSGTSNVCPTPEASRAQYDNVCDYYNLNNSGARDQFGSVIAGLENYNVSVTVRPNPVNAPTFTASISTLTNSFPTEIRVLQVDVTVTNSQFPELSIPLTGYRTNYNCNVATDTGCKPL